MSIASHEKEVLETIWSLLGSLLGHKLPDTKLEVPSAPKPFSSAPELLRADDIAAITGWSIPHVYKVMKSPGFKLANGGKKPYRVLKQDFIDFLAREAP